MEKPQGAELEACATPSGAKPSGTKTQQKRRHAEENTYARELKKVEKELQAIIRKRGELKKMKKEIEAEDRELGKKYEQLRDKKACIQIGAVLQERREDI